jgi:beta-galactosidase
MFIGTQYFRPPFPNRKYWDEDFDLIKETGIDAIQMWACWGWIESEPGKFNFEDYDELIKKAKKRGLKVVISTIVEIHPFWIHRVIPDSYMIDHMGNKVISSLREECNVGLTPGGCFDNPKVLELMGKFLQKISERYANEDSLIGWDCWNELRWNVQSDGYVCYCEYTLNEFRNWLKEKYGDLNGLNNAWRRKYCSWEDVFPGKLPGRPYTEMIEFLRFLTYRATKHMKFRYEQIRKFDKTHIISAHCASPSITISGWGYEQTLCRGNDWELADQLDGYGCSHFPFWGEGIDYSGYGIRVESVRSAVRDKVMWVSELQGGSARDGLGVHRSVLPKPQQMWVWNGIGRGAKGVIFWCWRDEVFGRESSGFGLSGNDGFAKERLKALNDTCNFIKKYNALIDNYKPDTPKVGVLFEPDTYYLNWAQDGNSKKAVSSILGYLTTLERLNIPYEVVESNHIDVINKLKLLIIPWPLIINKNNIQKLFKFVSEGGIILVEGELDAYDSLGFYRYSGEEREFANLFGIKDEGRRIIKDKIINFEINKKRFKLIPKGWFNPLDVNNATILCKSKEKYVLGVKKKIDKGSIFVIGTFLGMGYYEKPYKDFENFIYEVISEANALPSIKLLQKLPSIQYRYGKSNEKRLLFVINSGKSCEIDFKEDRKKFSLSLKADSWNVFLLDENVKLLK